MKKLLTDAINNSENYTLAVAEAMPEKDYNTQPAHSVWNFGELMNHIAYGIEWWTKNYVKKQEVGWQPPVSKKTKKETVANLRQAYDFLKGSLNGSPITDEQINGVNATLDHITHHRGQATTYLRLKEITPPEYTY